MKMKNPERIDRLRERIRKQLKKWDVPSVSICIIKDHEVCMAEGIGQRDQEAGISADAETLYQIASLSLIHI